jgi:diguanylate cyclase (GGDEF)-like protein
MIDLDHFKLVNDNYGHEAGDNVLIHVSNLIRDLLRTYDIFGRLGGEEFAALLPGSTYSNSRGIAERIVSELGESGIMVNSEKIQITTSIGIAEYHNTLGTLEKLIAEADRHLYEAKKEGRNQVKGC